MTKRIGAGEVGDRNIAMAADTRPPTHPVGIFEDGTTLYMPPLPTRTEEEREEAERQEREEREGGRYEIAWLVKEIHDCRHVHHGDPPCRKRAHRADVEAAAVMLSMLGLREAPETTGLPP